MEPTVPAPVNLQPALISLFDALDPLWIDLRSGDVI